MSAVNGGGDHGRSTGVDVCVIGAGSGGFGAACAAARHGARVALIEAGDGLGGTSTWAGVNNWEPVAGATGLPQEVYERLRRQPLAVALQQRRGRPRPDRPFGWFGLAWETDYRLSLSRRSGVPIAFEPAALDRALAELLAETPHCAVSLRTRFVDAAVDGRRVRAVKVAGPSGTRWIEAPVFVDASADLYLARAAGCAAHLGPETRDVYGEPSAPPEPVAQLNNASLCYRVTPLAAGEPRQIQPLPEGIDAATLAHIHPVTSIRTYPNGDLNLNPLRMMLGWEAYELARRGGPPAAYREAYRRMLAHWHLLQTRYGFEDWKLAWVSPMLGVRETHRLVARYVLREQDVCAGLAAQEAAGLDDIVAIADHALDFHGARPSRELPNGPYGVPFRCLLPQELDNLLVACRGAGFSAIAASSCRLSRTMMLLGQAAGTAAALFGGGVARFDARRLRQALQDDGVALTPHTGYLDAMPDLAPLQDLSCDDRSASLTPVTRTPLCGRSMADA